MTTSFSQTLSRLRRSKGISQKQAASDLGISQALLSHYERGIRECGLSFLLRAADYYAVSCDELLGRAPQADAHVPAELQILRAGVNAMLHVAAKQRRGEQDGALCRYLLLSAYRAMCLSKCGGLCELDAASALLQTDVQMRRFEAAQLDARRKKTALPAAEFEQRHASQAAALKRLAAFVEADLRQLKAME